MLNESNISVLILAAGSSSRMGRPKQLLKWKRTNLINHTILKAIKLKSRAIIVMLGSNAELIKQEIDYKIVKTLINPVWEKGLGSSISHGVKYISKHYPDTEGILIMLTDQPLIEYNHYSKLINCFDSNRKAIITTKYSDNKLGVPAVIDKFYFKELSNLNSDFGAKNLFIKHSDNVQSILNKKALLDVDTSEQYEKLYKGNHIN